MSRVNLFCLSRGIDEAMNNINKTGIRQVLDDLVINKKIPVLGICLGMQLLTNESEEGKEEGLSLYLQNKEIHWIKT